MKSVPLGDNLIFKKKKRKDGWNLYFTKDGGELFLKSTGHNKGHFNWIPVEFSSTFVQATFI